MTSLVWGRDPQEAFDNPYEYEVQEQFVREAEAFLKKMADKLDEYNMKFGKNDNSLQKATWMLLLDIVDSLKECLTLIKEKRHRVASRLFRDIVESLDLLKLFHSGTEKASKILKKWYENEVIPHGEARDYLKEIDSKETADNRRDYYRQLSKFTHRTYKALYNSYILGKEDTLVHDTHSQSQLLVLPHTIAAYFAILADLINQASEVSTFGGLIESSFIKAAWSSALEENTVPRRFVINRPVKKNME